MAQSDNNLFFKLGTLVPVLEGFAFNEPVSEPNINTVADSNAEHLHNDDVRESADDVVLQALISRIVDQDQSAFSSLFKAMSVRVNNLALRITGNLQLAEEVTEDTFFQIWRQAPRFDPERGSAIAWILTIARSRALDARRSIAVTAAVEVTDFATEDEGQPCSNPPDLLSVVEQNQLLHKALAALDSLPRQLLALSYFRGLSHEEIASHVGLPLGTVKSHIRRAVIQLRESLLNPAQTF